MPMQRFEPNGIVGILILYHAWLIGKIVSLYGILHCSGVGNNLRRRLMSYTIHYLLYHQFHPCNTSWWNSCCCISPINSDAIKTKCKKHKIQNENYIHVQPIGLIPRPIPSYVGKWNKILLQMQSRQQEFTPFSHGYHQQKCTYIVLE